MDELGPWLHRVLEALGHPEAYVTDLSTVDAFLDPTNPKASESVQAKTWLAHASKRLGVPLAWDDRLIEVADRVRTRASSPTP